MTRFDLQPAYVLHQRPYRNTSLLLEIFSRDQGRLGLVARGARKGARAALLQPFMALNMSWTLRDDLGTLVDVERRARPAPAMQGEALICGFYLNELLMRLCHRHDPQTELFQAYEQGLAELSLAGPEAALRRFELQLLNSLGYGLQLDADSDDGEPIEAGQVYCYRPESGPVRWRPGADGVRVDGASLRALAAGEFGEAAVLADARRLLRACLRPLLGDRPLRSRELYVSMLGLVKRESDTDE